MSIDANSFYNSIFVDNRFKPSAFAKWLKLERIKRGMSVAELSRASGVSETTLTALEKNKYTHTPHRRTIGNIVRALTPQVTRKTIPTLTDDEILAELNDAHTVLIRSLSARVILQFHNNGRPMRPGTSQEHLDEYRLLVEERVIRHYENKGSGSNSERWGSQRETTELKNTLRTALTNIIDYLED